MHPSISSFMLSRNAHRSKAFTSGQLQAVMLSLALFLATTLTASGQASSGATVAAAARSDSPGQLTETKSAPVTDPATIMRQARIIYVRKKTVYIEAPEVENELRKRPEFQRWGLAITRNEADADLIIEVGHKIFTRFVYTVIDPRTNIVVTSGKLSSLGGTLSTKIAKRFIEQMQKVRP